ncbi:CapA family protein [Sporosarcina sp. Te-1]|uniref:CapA family protein n=1 Tax=Sporosarcina sp. Te-1 TaxID=2818390 RepID=UPI001A9DE474|nr:CapA family protein [Sporosarcina sp. Te-1]QTD41112.1 CapA family protein [Sporosarcina sp. Te-1]
MRKRVLVSALTFIVLSGCEPFGESESVEVPNDLVMIDCKLDLLPLKENSTHITVGMIGDILLHNPLYKYEDYSLSFTDVSEELQGIDFLLANQESMPGGKELGLSGYPRFNSPKHIIRDLKRNGVDMINLANNHTMDQNEMGLRKAIAHMKEFDMPYIGAYESQEDKETQRIVDVEGIRIGVIAYTFGTNGLPVPSGKDYMVGMIDRVEMKEDIESMRGKVDVLVASVHWGTEYVLEPSDYQKELAQFLADAGVDIIFGHHPHVLQRYEKKGDTHVFYSLGNFFSAQQFDTTNIGGIGKVSIRKLAFAGHEMTTVGEAHLIPTAVIRNADRRFVVVPLERAGKQASMNVTWVEKHVGLTAE